MSEVKPVNRYKAQTLFSFGGAKIEYFPHGPEVVLASDFNAQRLRADTSEADLQEVCKTVEAVTASLVAAEQRIAELSANNQQLRKLLEQTLAALNPTAKLSKSIRDAINPPKFTSAGEYSVPVESVELTMYSPGGPLVSLGTFNRCETIEQLQARVQDLESGMGEPVAEVQHGPFDDVGAPQWVRVLTLGDFDLEHIPDGTKLFTAPPAPVAVVQFANDLIDVAFEGGNFGGDDIQDIAVKHGLLSIETRDEPCGEFCACKEYGFPAECYRKTACLDATAALNGERNTIHVGELDPAERLALARGETK